MLLLFSRSVVSDSLQPHGPQHARLPCPSPSPGAYSNSCPLSRWCHPTISSSVILLSSCLQSFPVSGLYCWVSPLPKYRSFSISTSNEYSGLISFRIDWFDLLEIQGTLRSLLQHHSPKAPILWRWAFFIVQLSHLYMTTGKMVALTIQTFVGKVMSLLFNILSRFVIAFLPRSKHLIILWLQPPSAVVLVPEKIKSVMVSTVSHSICHDVTGCHDLHFLNVSWDEPSSEDASSLKSRTLPSTGSSPDL